MHLQSHNARGQAGLLIGRDKVIRVDAPTVANPIKLDDWRRAVAELPNMAVAAVNDAGPEICATFLGNPAAQFHPIAGPLRNLVMQASSRGLKTAGRLFVSSV